MSLALYPNRGCGPFTSSSGCAPTCPDTSVTFESGTSCVGCIVDAGKILGKIFLCKPAPVLQMPGCPLDQNECPPPTLWYISIAGEVTPYDAEVHGEWTACPEAIIDNITPIQVGEICY